jgi:hypothetical protein
MTAASDHAKPICTYRRVAALSIAAALALAGCSSSSDDDTATSDTTGPTTTAAPPPNSTRPEGTWNVVTWQIERDGDPDNANRGLAKVRVHELTPTCDTGPCNLDVKPAGEEGTYLPPGMPIKDSARPDPSDPARTYVWDPSAKTYTLEVKQTGVDCTSPTAGEVKGVYDGTTTYTLTFTPATDEKPASMRGTYTDISTATPEGEAQGCTKISESGVIAASPVDALATDDSSGLAASYTPTESVIEHTDTERPLGFTGKLTPMTITSAAEGFTIKGLTGAETALTGTDSGWKASTEPVEGSCNFQDGQVVESAYSVTESWTDLRPVTRTEAGGPVLIGTWTMDSQPTDAGTAGGCPAQINKGFIVLVPVEATGDTATG